MADPITQVVQSLGLVTAYGYAKSKGYTGTEEEFAEAAAAIGQGAATASAAAEAASEDAGTATTAAGTATTAAGNAGNSATAALQYMNNAETAATNAGTAQTAAAGSATSAAASAQAAATSEYNAGVAAGASSDYALDSQDHAEDSEAWAVGTKNGNPVPETADQYNNNAKHYAEQASGEVTSAEAQATAAAASATAAAASAVSAEAWATGGSGGTAGATNNAEYWAGQAATQAEAAAGSAASGIAALANEAPTFDATAAYSAGEYVLYNSVLYQFTTDHAAGAWTGTDATAVKIGSDLTDLERTVKPLMDAYNSADWETGSIKAADGTTISSTTRIRTKTGIASGTSAVFAGDGYEVCVYGWNGSTYLGVWTGLQFEFMSINTGAFKPSINISAAWQTADTIRLLAGKAGGATIAAADGANIYYQAGTSLSEINRSATVANNRIDHLMRDINRQALWEYGSLSNGRNTSNNTRLRTITYLQSGTQKITAGNGYEFVVCCYNPSTNEYAGIVKEDGTVGTASFYWHTSVDVGGLNYKMRLVLRNPEDTVSDMPLSAYANISLLSAVDAGLATSGTGADAKVTGDRLAALDAEAQYGHYSVRRNNPEYVSAMMTIAQSYVAANSDTILRNSRHFVYGNNSILQLSTSTNLIDCSTFVGLVLRGYALSETSYMADVSLRSPSAWVAKPGVAWAIDPFDFKVVSKPGENPSRLRWAAQLAEWMIERSQVVPMSSGLAEVMPGDILFWARKNPETGEWVEPLRYRHISHVGFCLSRTKTPENDADVDATVYPYKHMTIEVGHETYDTDGVTVLEGCVKSKLVEAEPVDPADWDTTNNIHTLVLVCRPDLGSI